MFGAYRFQVDTIESRMIRLRTPLTVAWLADLHYGPFIREGSLAAWVDTTLALRSDLVLLGGDLVDYLQRGSLDPLLEQLSRIQAPLGVWGVWGNHDHHRLGPMIGDFEVALDAAGVRILRNRGALVRDDLFLAGIDDLRTGRPDLRAALAERPADVPCLLLSHNPDVLPAVPLSVDLTLCGHTHGGQVCLPGVGAVVTSSRYGRRFVSGWVEGPARGYVSRGLGVTHLPLRLGCPAELTHLTLLVA